VVDGRIEARDYLRLAQFFGSSAELWVNLQAHYDLEIARDTLEGRIRNEVKPMQPRKEANIVEQR
jgi:plasmid maintenance system antidote protein VapI